MALNFPGGCLAPKLELWGYTQTSGYEVESCNLVSEISHRRTSLLLLTIFHIHLLLMNFNLISVFIVLFCFLVSILLSRSCFVENSVLFCFPVLPFSLKSKKVFFPEVEFSIFCFQPKLQSSLEVWRAKLFHWRQRFASSHSFRLDGAIVVAWTASTSTD